MTPLFTGLTGLSRDPYSGALLVSDPSVSPGNRVAMIGDSITIGNTGANDNNIRGDKDPLLHAHWLSDGKLGYWKNAGISGNKLSDMIARVQADVIGMSPGPPDWCVILSGTNDASNGVTAAQYRDNMQTLIGMLQGAGIKPVICTNTPNPAGAQRKTVANYDAWIRQYAWRTGIPIADPRGALIDSTTGGYLAAMDSGDGIHPTNLGAQAIGQAIVNAIGPLMQPSVPPLPKFDTADKLGIMSGGMFLTNTAGVGTGWTKTGSAVASIVAPVGGDALGNWQRVADTVNEFTQVNTANVSTGFAVGDRLMFVGRLRSNVTSGQVKVIFSLNPSIQAIQQIINPGLGSTTAHTFAFEITVPANTTSFNWSIQTQAGTGMQIDVAQLDVINLTAAGLA